MCRVFQNEADAVATAMTAETNPNIVFVVLDTCRARTFHRLLDDGRLPATERIAVNAAVYRNASAAAPWTVPSHGSMFSGRYPTDHGTSADDPCFDPPTTPLAERLRRAGYETVGLSANPWVTDHFWFTAGFDRFKTDVEYFWGGADTSGLGRFDSLGEKIAELRRRTSVADAPATFVNVTYRKLLANRRDSGARRLTTDAVRWLNRRSSDDPFFLFCNFTEPHLRYDPPDDLARKELPAGVDLTTARSVEQDQWAYVTGQLDLTDEDFEILRALYRAEIRYLDSQLGRLFDRLESQEGLDETAVILTSDHGENIGDHGLMDHQYGLYETLLHVPLVVRYPPAFDAGPRDVPVETRRLYETVADLAGIDRTEPGTAPSLVGDPKPDAHLLAEYTSPQPSVETLAEEYGPLDADVRRYDRSLRSIRTARWKYIEGSDGTTELYDLRDDPEELTPVDDPDVRADLRKRLEECRGALAGPGAESEETEIDGANAQRLRDLGYL
jgi:arylsulfatase A-like enzyme